VPQTVTLASTTDGAKIFYTTNNGDPAGGTEYTQPFSVAVYPAMTVKAVAVKEGMIGSGELSASYTLMGTVVKPVATPAAGAILATESVTLTSETAAAVIRYTTNDSVVLGAATGELYSDPIAGTDVAGKTLRAIALKDDMITSAELSAAYTQPATATPTLPEGGTTLTSKVITLSTPAPDDTAEIWYTTDGVTTPAQNGLNATKYGTSSFTITQTMTIKAIAVATGKVPSDVVTADYTIQTAQPTLPAAGNATLTSRVIDITKPTTDTAADIYYTTNGTAPVKDEAGTTKYTAALTISQTTTVKAIAIATGKAPSTAASQTYTIQTQPPTLPSSSGTTAGTKTITITTPSPDAAAVIYYTTNGSAPPTSGTANKYTGAFTISQTTTVKAVSVATGKIASTVPSATYTIQTATPVPSSGAGSTTTTFTAAQTLKFTAISGVTLRYTKTEDAGVDPLDPDSSSELFPSGGLLVEVNNTIVKVRAFKTGCTDSAVLKQTYKMNISRKLVALAASSDKAVYSDNGTSWTAATMPSSASWSSVTYGNGKFVAVSYYGSTAAAYSSDGITWTAATLPSRAWWKSVTYGNGKFVAVTYDNAASAYSTDGITWVAAAALPSSADWKSVTYGNGKFVAVAGSTASAYSSDGITWTAATLPSSASWYSVTYGGGKFVAISASGNKAAYSSDGTSWTATTYPITGNSVTYGNGKFVTFASSGAESAYSSDGITWTAATLPSSGYWNSCK
jgi:hypothetical protein